MKAVVGETVVAEAASEAVVSIEGNIYFPPNSVAAARSATAQPLHLPLEGESAVSRRCGRRAGAQGRGLVLPEHQGVGGDSCRSRLQRLRRLRCTPGQDRELTRHTDHCQQNKSVVEWGRKNFMSEDFEGRKIVVVGGSGIGLATTQQVLAGGGSAVITGRNPDRS